MKKHHTVVNELFIRGWKLNNFFDVLHTLIVPAPKHSTLPNGDSKQTKISTNWHYFFI